MVAIKRMHRQRRCRDLLLGAVLCQWASRQIPLVQPLLPDEEIPFLEVMWLLALSLQLSLQRFDNVSLQIFLQLLTGTRIPRIHVASCARSHLLINLIIASRMGSTDRRVSSTRPVCFYSCLETLNYMLYPPIARVTAQSSTDNDAAHDNLPHHIPYRSAGEHTDCSCCSTSIPRLSYNRTFISNTDADRVIGHSHR